ncbi:hypothetical protein KL918_000088 [Ogataea parapolymorpha]|uniref:ATP-dependent helicase ULS1 n=1 Tax=Ogataea parapolymorpha (strain ATCC 26012 / BCRC 20466 / JCM 22074 / NRRL Y-7560 / DL-1) TaxID=871575 RepID=W1Q753_OGAPD|nr:hypothetical protein HPODL_02776 [Ogataea parapolymorpha DL-1]ESW96139.1 hypothetical protein HPODL_02776 [Ogataea parapolymorpha DL-1]KAG7869884.1 hypothetical protein KL918_000088 [Ogataea parapolymorpha]KAG7873172.1 hypothetical protein KL916_002473 [Ogataea parapolymorpha]
MSSDEVQILDVSELSPRHDDRPVRDSSETSPVSSLVSPQVPAMHRFVAPYRRKDGIRDETKRQKLEPAFKSEVIDLTSDAEEEEPPPANEKRDYTDNDDGHNDDMDHEDDVVFVKSTNISPPTTKPSSQPHALREPLPTTAEGLRNVLVQAREYLHRLNENVKRLMERRTAVIKYLTTDACRNDPKKTDHFQRMETAISAKIERHFMKIRITSEKIQLLCQYEHHFNPRPAVQGDSLPRYYGEPENSGSSARTYDTYAFNPYMQRFNNYSDADDIQHLLDTIKPDEAYEDGDVRDPEDLSVALLKHQKIGLKWMLSMEESANKGGILADDMGLGKTVQAIALMAANKAGLDECKTNLVVAPVSLLQQWGQELDFKLKKQSQTSYFIFHQGNKLNTFKEMTRYDVVLVSYNTLTSEMKKHYRLALEELKTKKATLPERDDGGSHYRSPFYTSDAVFHRIILDEAQAIKNKLTQTSKAVALLDSKYRWCLSGTPIQNNIDELYPILRFLKIKPYCEEARFKERISNALRSKYGGETRGVQTVQALLTAILLRRTKKTLIDGKPILQLPEKHVVVNHVEMKEDERKFYYNLEAQSADTAKRILAGSGDGHKHKGGYSAILTLLLRLRQACDHKFLVKIGENKEREFKVSTIKNGFETAKRFDRTLCDQINEQWKSGFSCQMCFDVIEADANVILLGSCGHAVCRDCQEQFFEDNTETVWNGVRSARCKTCNKSSSESLCVELLVFDSVCNKRLEWRDVQKQFNIQTQSLNSAQRIEKIKGMIASEGGQLEVSAKIERCLTLIKDILETKPGEKVIVFSQFMVLFDILELFLRDHGIEYLRYDGSMNVEAKSASVATFYQDPNKKVMLLSLKAGNVGLTLTCASHVIILEPFWNPFVEKQAQDRVHRISQVREVYVHRILIRNTVEDRIIELQAEKEKLVESALDPTARQQVNRLSRVELGFLFGLNGLSGLENV